MKCSNRCSSGVFTIGRIGRWPLWKFTFRFFFTIHYWVWNFSKQSNVTAHFCHFACDNFNYWKIIQCPKIYEKISTFYHEREPSEWTFSFIYLDKKSIYRCQPSLETESSWREQFRAQRLLYSFTISTRSKPHGHGDYRALWSKLSRCWSQPLYQLIAWLLTNPPSFSRIENRLNSCVNSCLVGARVFYRQACCRTTVRSENNHCRWSRPSSHLEEVGSQAMSA